MSNRRSINVQSNITEVGLKYSLGLITAILIFVKNKHVHRTNFCDLSVFTI